MPKNLPIYVVAALSLTTSMAFADAHQCISTLTSGQITGASRVRANPPAAAPAINIPAGIIAPEIVPQGVVVEGAHVEQAAAERPVENPPAAPAVNHVDQAQAPVAENRPAEVAQPEQNQAATPARAPRQRVSRAEQRARADLNSELRQELSALVDRDVEGATRYLENLQHQNRLRERTDRYRRSIDTGLDVDEHKWSAERQNIELNLRNGFFESIVNTYRTFSYNYELNYFKLMVNNGRLARNQFPEGVTRESTLAENEGLDKYFAERRVDYRNMIQFFQDVVSMNPESGATPEATAQARLRLRNFAQEASEKPVIYQTARGVLASLHLVNIRGGLRGLFPDSVREFRRENGESITQLLNRLFSIESMDQYFFGNQENLTRYLEAKRVRQFFYSARLLVGTKEFFTQLVERARNIPVVGPILGPALRTMFNYNREAAFRNRYLNQTNEVLDSTGTPADRLQRMMDFAGASDATDSNLELRVSHVYTRAQNTLMKRVELIEKVRIAGVVTQEIPRQTSEVEVTGPARNLFNNEINAINANQDANAQAVTTIRQTVRQVVTKDFLVAMFRFTHTDQVWGQVRAYVEEQSALPGNAGKMRMYTRYMEDAETVGIELGPLPASTQSQLSLSQGGAVLGALATAPWTVPPIYNGLVHNPAVQNFIMHTMPSILHMFGVH